MTLLVNDNIQSNTIVASNFVPNSGILIAGDGINIEANGRISLVTQ